MSEKRFVLIEDDLEPLILDNKETMSVNEVVDLLNEQQDKITELEIELTDCKNRKEQSEYNLRRENEQLRKQVAEYELILRQHEFAEKEGFQ